MHSLFTLYFDGSMWVAVYEINHDDGTVQAARHVFGPEPSHAQLWDWILHHGMTLINRAHEAPRITPSLSNRSPRAGNPKKVARLAAKEAAKQPASTAAQEALARGRELQKSQKRKQRSRDRQAEAAQRYAMRSAKRRQKRRGH